MIPIHIGNGFCVNLSNKFQWSNLVSDKVKKTQQDEKEENLELLLRKIHEESKKEELINDFFNSFMNKHPGYLLLGDYFKINYECIRDSLLECNSIFTLNYDLILYWILIDMAEKIKDDFCKGQELEFNHFVLNKSTGAKIYYLHGALHLFSKNDKACKLKFKDNIGIVRQFKEKKELPLYVFESCQEKKLEQIKKFAYLKYCYKKLGEIEGNICIFGSSLGCNQTNDEHILEKILENKKIHKIHLGGYGMDDELPNALKILANRVIPFDSKKITFNDSCVKGYQSPEDKRMEKLMLNALITR